MITNTYLNMMGYTVLITAKLDGINIDITHDGSGKQYTGTMNDWVSGSIVSESNDVELTYFWEMFKCTIPPIAINSLEHISIMSSYDNQNTK